jgi:hypothetical protein
MYTVSSGNSPSFACATSSSLLRGRGARFQDGVAAGEGFLCAPFWSVHICDYSAAWVSCNGLEKTNHKVIILLGGTDTFWKVDSCVTSSVLVDLVCLMTTLKECVRRVSEVPASQWLQCTHWRIVINARETWTVAAAESVRCVRVRWEINLLLAF